MTPLQIIFLVVGGLTLASAVMVVSVRRMLHAALWLVLTLLGVAILFATLESSFFTVVQVVIYIGAIAILIIFAIMLTRPDIQEKIPAVNRGAWLAALTSALVFVGITGGLSAWHTFDAVRPTGVSEDIAALGLALVSPDAYVIPFEVASVMLMAALIGAIYVAGNQQQE